jgi:hypothetical protein
MGAVSSFRDRLNPEAVHFPAKIGSKVLIVCGAVVMVFCALPGYWVEQPMRQTLIDSALAAVGIGFILLCWPNYLKTDQFGVSQQSPFPHRRVFIPYKDVASVEVKPEFGRILSGLGIDGEALVVYSSEGRKVTHGPRHPDRPRFLHELEIHGVTRTENGTDAERE